jgi:hypothetical protein
MKYVLLSCFVLLMTPAAAEQPYGPGPVGPGWARISNVGMTTYIDVPGIVRTGDGVTVRVINSTGAYYVELKQFYDCHGKGRSLIPPGPLHQLDAMQAMNQKIVCRAQPPLNRP